MEEHDISKSSCDDKHGLYFKINPLDGSDHNSFSPSSLETNLYEESSTHRDCNKHDLKDLGIMVL